VFEQLQSQYFFSIFRLFFDYFHHFVAKAKKPAEINGFTWQRGAPGHASSPDISYFRWSNVRNFQQIDNICFM